MDIEAGMIGECCACRRRDVRRHIVLLNCLAPVSGTGWGCLVCNMPNDGGLGLVCSRCVAKGRNKAMHMMLIVSGYVMDDHLIDAAPWREKPFDHDLEVHDFLES